MKTNDPNRRYYLAGLYLLSKGRDILNRRITIPHIEWIKQLGLQYESFLQELVVKGVANSSAEGWYISDRFWQLNKAEAVEELKKIYHCYGR